MASRSVVVSLTVAAAVTGGLAAGVALGAGGGIPTCAPDSVRLSLGPRVSPMTGEHADLFVLTDRSPRACALDGYPSVRLNASGRRLPFLYLKGGGLYVTKQLPQAVTLGPMRRAYFLVAKYRCDVGILQAADSAHVQLPPAPGALTIGLVQGGGGLDYCESAYPGDQHIDPGNRVTVSPVEASALATFPVP